jgi:hypothetical protein
MVSAMHRNDIHVEEILNCEGKGRVMWSSYVVEYLTVKEDRYR